MLEAFRVKTVMYKPAADLVVRWCDKFWSMEEGMNKGEESFKALVLEPYLESNHTFLSVFLACSSSQSPTHHIWNPSHKWNLLSYLIKNFASTKVGVGHSALLVKNCTMCIPLLLLSWQIMQVEETCRAQLWHLCLERVGPLSST